MYRSQLNTVHFYARYLGIVDGNLEMSATAHVSSNICYMICLRHLIRSRVKNRFFFLRKTYFPSSVFSTDLYIWINYECGIRGRVSLSESLKTFGKFVSFKSANAMIFKFICIFVVKFLANSSSRLQNKTRHFRPRHYPMTDLYCKRCPG